MTPFRIVVAILCAFALSILTPAVASACQADGLDGSFNNDLTANLNQLGMFMMDARDTDACAQAAASRLKQNLTTTAASYWQQANAGYFVTLVMATALELGGRDLLDTDLDTAVYGVTKAYMPVTGFGGACGWSNPPGNWQNGNTCMDDYVGIASGEAWMAAFLRLSGRDWIGKRNDAAQNLHNALSTYDSICIYNANAPFSNTTGPCNATPADLGTPYVSILSLNHGAETPAYGIGMMTSFAAAWLGLEIAHWPVGNFNNFSDDERKIIEYLFREGQAKSQNGYVYPDFLSYTCEWLGDFYSMAGYPCWDFGQFGWGASHYHAAFFPVQNFYLINQFITGDQSLYQFDTFDESQFSTTTLSTPWGAGRRETYKTLADDWFSSYPNLTARHDFQMNLATTQWNTWFMRAPGGGGPGSVVDATATDPNSTESRIWMIDLNEGALKDRDSVALKTSNGYYISAEGGGGSTLSADRTAQLQWETFTIYKVGGSVDSYIAEGDQFVLKTWSGYYVSADNDGGGGVNAIPLTYGANETWTFRKWDPPTP